MVCINLPDIQGKKLDNSFKLTRVGITGVKKPVHVKRPERIVTLTVLIDVFVDLPATQKGSHMSRHVEVINARILPRYCLPGTSTLITLR